MQILEKKESKLLGRTDVDVLFPDKAGALTRRDAVIQVAQSLKVEESRVALLKLASGSGSRDLLGTFRVYDSEGDLKNVSPHYLKERLMTKEEMVEIFPSNTRPGNAMIRTLTSWPALKSGLSDSATFASIHMVEVSATENGAGALPG